MGGSGFPEGPEVLFSAAAHPCGDALSGAGGKVPEHLEGNFPSVGLI